MTMMMKSVAVLVVFVVASTHAIEHLVPADVIKEFMQTHDKCVAETGVTEEMIKRARHGDFPSDESFHCYLRCFMEHYKLFNDDDTVNLQRTIEMIPEEVMHIFLEPVKKCIGVVGHNRCDTAFKTVHCIWEQDKENFYLV